MQIIYILKVPLDLPTVIGELQHEISNNVAF